MITIKAKVGTRGQIVIPKPIREMFQIHAGEDMFFRVENNEILMTRWSSSGTGRKTLG